MVNQVAQKNPLGDIIVLNIEDLVVDSGRYDKLWDITFDIIKIYIMDHSWMYSTIDYNNSHNISITVSHVELHPVREKDNAIMQKGAYIFDIYLT